MARKAVSRNRLTPKICTKKDSFVPHLIFKIQVSTFSRFKVIAVFIFVAEFVNFTGKNRDFQREALRKSQ